MELLSIHLRLSDLNELIAEVIEQSFPGPFWVIAEVAAVNSAGPAGHTYFDLVEKRGDEVAAQAKANLWRSRREVLAHFERVTRRRLERGMQILLLAQPNFHPRYGFSLEISDIDPNFTLGEMARRRQDVIDRLTDEDLLDRNNSLTLSPAPQRIAVISSSTAAGWQDFERRLAHNPNGYSFFPTLFPALVQGEGAETSILAAMSQIRRAASRFDCAALIRGGGGTVDLSCFDSYALARAIAECPLPMICGIGHERDRCVCDLAAYHSAATPTAAAEFLVSRVRSFEDELTRLAGYVLQNVGGTLTSEAVAVEQMLRRFTTTSLRRIRSETDGLQSLTHRASSAVRTSVAQSGNKLAGLSTRVELLPTVWIRDQVKETAALSRAFKAGTERQFERLSNELSLLEHDVLSRDPAAILRRGYSITRSNGRIVRDANNVAVGEYIETQLYRGRVESMVKKAEVKT